MEPRRSEEGVEIKKMEFPLESDKFQPITTKDSPSKLVESTSKPSKKIYPRDPIEEELRIEGGKAWQYYGAAQTRILEQINQAKYQRTKERLVLERREGKLEEWEKRLHQALDLPYRESN